MLSANKGSRIDLYHPEPASTVLSHPPYMPSSSRSLKNFKDLPDTPDSRIHFRESYEMIPTSPIKSLPVSTLHSSSFAFSLAGGSRALLQASARPSTAIHSISASRPSPKYSDVVVDGRSDSEAANFSVATDALPPEMHAQGRSSVASLSPRHHQPLAASSGATDMQSPAAAAAAWYPWPEWSSASKLDVATRERLVQSLMSNSIERRKTAMSIVNKLPAPGVTSEVMLKTTTSIPHQSVNMSPNRPQNYVHSNHSNSISPKGNSVSPKQQSLLGGGSLPGPLYHLPPPRPSSSARYVSVQSARTGIDTGRQATVPTTSPNSVGRLSQVGVGNGSSLLSSHLHPHAADKGFSGTI